MATEAKVGTFKYQRMWQATIPKGIPICNVAAPKVQQDQFHTMKWQKGRGKKSEMDSYPNKHQKDDPRQRKWNKAETLMEWIRARSTGAQLRRR